MSIGISEDHNELAASLRGWAVDGQFLDHVRAVEEIADEPFDGAWEALSEMGLATIGLAESLGGGGGTLLDVAVALEACAEEVLPGHLLANSIACALVDRAAAEPVAHLLAGGARVALALTGSLATGETLSGDVDVVWDAPGADLFVLPAGERWFVVRAEHVTVTPHVSLDLTRRFGTVRVAAPMAEVTELTGVTTAVVRRVAITLAAAEAAGVARWCLRTAVDYAKVREQFGKPIGSFQAIKHLCAEMLETAEAVTAVAWDAAAAAAGEEEQWAYAADVAGTTALNGAVKVAQDCIQVLGGIGFTFEHEAHFRLRRVISLRNLLGSGDDYALSLADRAADGVRRRLAVDLEGRDDAIRGEVRAQVAALAALEGQAQRAAMVECGYLTPHWAAPYGLSADAVTQLVIDQELAAAGVARPDLKIGGWAVPTILEHGTDAQREQFVRPTLLGDVVWCQLFSEPGAGSDLASLRTKAERVDGGWKLTGQKVWTSLAQDAHWAICLGRTNPDAPQHKGITYFLVDMTSDGLDVRPLREMTGEALFNEVFLDGVFVPDSHVVGEVDGGWRLARTTLANERVAMAGTRLDVSVERAVQLLDGASITETARVGHAVALATICSILGTRTVLRSLAGQGPGAESSVAKLLGVRNRQDASEMVVDLLGARMIPGGRVNGVDVERAVHEMLLTRCLSIAGGTTQVLRNVAGERILGLPR